MRMNLKETENWHELRCPCCFIGGLRCIGVLDNMPRLKCNGCKYEVRVVFETSSHGCCVYLRDLDEVEDAQLEAFGDTGMSIRAMQEIWMKKHRDKLDRDH